MALWIPGSGWEERKMAELTKQELYAHVGADEVQAEHIEKPQLSYWKDVVRRFFSNKVAILSVAVLAVLIVMAIVGPFCPPTTTAPPMSPLCRTSWLRWAGRPWARIVSIGLAWTL